MGTRKTDQKYIKQIKTTFSRMSEIFYIARCPNLPIYLGGAFRQGSPPSSAPAPSVSWKNPTERWTQKQPPQELCRQNFFGDLFPLGKLGKFKNRGFWNDCPKIFGGMIYFGGMGSGYWWWAMNPTNEWIMEEMTVS